MYLVNLNFFTTANAFFVFSDLYFYSAISAGILLDINLNFTQYITDSFLTKPLGWQSVSS